jgi:hypothetical protein
MWQKQAFAIIATAYVSTHALAAIRQQTKIFGNSFFVNASIYKDSDGI